MNTYDVIKFPLVTEKTTRLYDETHQVSFVVDRRANKVQIKESIEKAFGVSVLGVRTISAKGKWKRLGRFVGKRSDWKKAVIQLKEEDKIEYFGGA